MKKPFLAAALLYCFLAAQALSVDATPPAQTASPESVGMSSERLARIKAVWQREIEADSFAGCVSLIARDGKIVYYEAVGHRDAKLEHDLKVDDIFCCASLTKPIVSVATLMLVEQGVLKLSDPIGKHLKEFDGIEMMVEETVTDANGEHVSTLVPAKKPILLYDLLRHTSGFSNAKPGVKKAYREQNIGAPLGPISGDEMLSRLAKIPLSYQPGTTFSYGISTDVLGLLLERVKGKDLEKVLQEMVLHPLKMYETGFLVPAEKSNRLAEYPMTEPNRDTLIHEINMGGRAGTSYFQGAGGLSTTVLDYSRFAQFMLNKGELDGVRLLSPKTIEMMTSDHLMDTTTPSHTVALEGPGYGFGLGVGVRKAAGGSWFLGSKGDYNWGDGHGGYYFADPEEKLFGIYMSYGNWNRGHIRQIFKNMAYAAIMEEYE